MPTEQVKHKRKKITIALDRFPDVARMLERLEHDYPGTTRTHHVATALREKLTRLGYARKKDLAQ